MAFLAFGVGLGLSGASEKHKFLVDHYGTLCFMMPATGAVVGGSLGFCLGGRIAGAFIQNPVWVSLVASCLPLSLLPMIAWVQAL